MFYFHITSLVRNHKYISSSQLNSMRQNPKDSTHFHPLSY